SRSEKTGSQKSRSEEAGGEKTGSEKTGGKARSEKGSSEETRSQKNGRQGDSGRVVCIARAVGFTALFSFAHFPASRFVRAGRRPYRSRFPSPASPASRSG